MSKIMYINGKAVGNGSWKLASVNKYCEKKKIELKDAYSITATCDYAFTSYLNPRTGNYNDGQATDHYMRAGL